MKIQAKLDKLNQLVAWFDGEEFDIEDALNKYKEAEKLAEEISKDLTTIKNEVSVISEGFDKKLNG